MNNYHESLDDSSADLEIAPSGFNDQFFSRAGSHRKYTRDWLAPAIVVVLIIIFVILAILTGVLFGHYSVMVEELTVLKYNASNPASQEDVKGLWKSVNNIMGDLSKIKKQVETSAGTCDSCPPGWQRIRSNCYLFRTSLLSWEKSREQCAIQNAVPLILKDMNEMNALLPFIKRERYWLGLKRDTENIDLWLWADGTPLTFSAWNDGEPNNDQDNEDCAEILGGVQAWNDRPCENSVAYICKGVWEC
ncbi:perlucin-like protein [Gastrophryne carolinensis]